MRFLTATAVFFFFLLYASPSFALTDPRSVPNNKFGVHIIDENDIDDAAKVLNSSGGDWGYVKLVIREDDRNLDKWQNIFDDLRSQHLIPIIRLATKVKEFYWEKPRVEDIGSWVDFLNNLNWVTENRYVVIFNEPNHSKEWGDDLNPEEYAWYLKEFSRRLKEKSSDFFILPAGLDASAPQGLHTMDYVNFVDRMVKKEPDVFEFIDGWTSHSYPNPGFVGSPYDRGRGSIRTFEWEKQLLKKYTQKDFAIFIAETGWQHSDGISYRSNFPSPAKVGEYYTYAFNSVWNDSSIFAVTPFVFNYQGEPFDQFSWKKIGSSEFNDIYIAISNISKTVGKPKQRNSAELNLEKFPLKLTSNSYYVSTIEIKNTGQAIFSVGNDWQLRFENLPPEFNINSAPIQSIKPFGSEKIVVSVKTPAAPGLFPGTIKLMHGDETIESHEFTFEVIDPPSLSISAKQWLNKPLSGKDTSIVIYNYQDQVVAEYNGVSFLNGTANIPELHNVALDQQYRFVLTRPNYLPRQAFARVILPETIVEFDQLLPLDFSGDGGFSFEDIKIFFQKPISNFVKLLSL